MNNTKKRQLNIRNKLISAIAMLLVSSIMMVSTTYAWFTLSTAPEVQGITTTVGANGNLEIALSPANGDASGITSAMGDSQLDWTLKNLTWGNLIDLSDSSYGLGSITLLPARLNLSAAGTTPLKTPVYGADGRIYQLEANSAIGKLVPEGESMSFVVDTNYRGVRAIGTSSSMTKYQITFNNYLASMGQNAASAQDLAEISLKNNGSKLAEMAMAHASASDDSETNYIAYKTNMSDAISNMQAANAKLKDAIRDGFIATAASNTTDNSEETYDAVMLLVNADPTATLETLMKSAGLMEDDGTVSGTDEISTAYKMWAAIEADLTAANTELGKIGETMSWTEASNVLHYLMNTTGIKLNGYSLSEFKTQAKRYVTKPNSTDTFPNSTYTASSYTDALVQYEAAKTFMAPFTSGSTKMQLGSGSGVYADMGAMVGNLSADVNVDVVYESGSTNINLPDVPINIQTTTASSDSGYLGEARIALATVGAFQDSSAGSTGVLNETYGYIVDFMFRTNASGSSLLLQTDAAQRVYSDGNSEATLGGGSTMTFRTGNISGSAVQGLMECIRVVFLDTKTGDILGIAKLDMENPTQTVVTEATENTAAVVDITAKLYLCDYSENATTGALELTNPKTTTAAAVLCELPTNTAKAVSAMVYLDGDNVSNEDVANAATSTTGTLNLQFASSVTLIPMENEALKNMAAQEETPAVSLSATTVTIQTSETLTEDVAVTVTGYTSTTSTSVTATTVTLNGTTTSGTATVYTGNVAGQTVDYDVTAPDGYTVTETSDNVWTLAVAAND